MRMVSRGDPTSNSGTDMQGRFSPTCTTSTLHGLTISEKALASLLPDSQ